MARTPVESTIQAAATATGFLRPRELWEAVSTGKLSPAEAMAQLNLRKALEEELKQEADAEQEARAAEARLKVIQAQIEEIERFRAACNHRKKNGEPRIVGQRDHHGNTIYQCSWCQMTYNQHTLPPLLQPDANIIGGP